MRKKLPKSKEFPQTYWVYYAEDCTNKCIIFTNLVVRAEWLNDFLLASQNNEGNFVLAVGSGVITWIDPGTEFITA